MIVPDNLIALPSSMEVAVAYYALRAELSKQIDISPVLLALVSDGSIKFQQPQKIHDEFGFSPDQGSLMRQRVAVAYDEMI